jgi:hypothetical protein
MDDPVKWALILGASCVLLGFFALLSSRIYVDAASATAVEVEVPFFGKLKSNYPALAFVLLGTALAAYAVKADSDFRGQKLASDAKLDGIKASAPGDELWGISGRLVSADGKPVDWARGEFTLFSGSPDLRILPDGHFEVKLRIRKGEDLEHYVQKIDYSNFESGSVTIYPQAELEKFNKSEGLLEAKTELTRKYKPVKLQAWNQPSP